MRGVEFEGVRGEREERWEWDVSSEKSGCVRSEIWWRVWWEVIAWDG